MWEALRAVFDPEIPVNIVDLGLVYDLAVEPDGAGRNAIEIKMTLTAPGCGMGPVIAEDARQKVAALPGVAAGQGAHRLGPDLDPAHDLRGRPPEAGAGVESAGWGDAMATLALAKKNT